MVRFMKLHLERPFAVFDIESTGINRKVDRIIDLAIIKLRPDGKRDSYSYRVHPGTPIPPESTAVHGITDADVDGCPSFSEIAETVHEVLEGCDLGGFNVLHFDIPLLTEEFARAGIVFRLDDRRVVDAQRIFHRKEPRDLSAALQFYCGEMHLDAHGALADVEATLRVMEGQFERYPDLPTDMDELEAFCNPRDPAWADRTGRLKWVEDQVVINFGKNQGKSLRTLVSEDNGFLNWILKNDFPADTKDLVRNALAGHFPTPPKG